MAKLVLIDTGTYQLNKNSIDDIVSIYEDDVFLGDSYNTFRIVDLPEIPASEVVRVLHTYSEQTPESKKYEFNLKDLLDTTKMDEDKIKIIKKAKKYAK